MSCPSNFLYASMMWSIVVFNAINALKMVDVHGKITLKVNASAGLETLEEFELGLEEVWERAV